MNALILAAGSGERLGGGGEKPPKPLLRFEGRSLLERHLDSFGVRRRRR
jgi:choline kinase